MEEEYQQIFLIVDDDEVYRNRLCRAFADRGWRALAAADGDSALQLAAEHGPDLVVVDLRLVGMVGLDIVRELRRLDQDTCIIMLTGYGSIATALTAMRLGANHYLSKPVDTEEILSTFQKVVASEDEQLDKPANLSVPSLARVEWEHIQRVLADCGGNISQTARRLGLQRRSLQRKLGKFPPRS
jgi:two-component system response regulator RegA